MKKPQPLRQAYAEEQDIKKPESQKIEYALIHIMKLCANILQNQQFLHFILKLRKATLRQNTSTSWRRAKTWYDI